MAEVTLKDIAKECGISFSAVSKALKGSREISEERRQLVIETAKRLGYHPNAAASSLRTNRTKNLGLIFEDSTGSGLQHQYFARIFDSINVNANKAGYDITFLNSSNTNGGDYLGQAKYRGCDGVIIASTNFYREDIQKLLQSDMPVSTLDFIDKDRHPAAMSDNFTGMKILTEEIIKAGHKKIAFIHGSLNTAVTKIRVNTFKDCIKNYNIFLPDNYIVEGDYHDPHSSAEGTKKLLELDESMRPTCILYPDDFAALGGIRVLEERGIKPGRDISITGYDGIFLASLLTPPLTTYEQNTKAIGSALVDELVKQIENPKTYCPQIVSVHGQFVKGGSLIECKEEKIFQKKRKKIP